MTRLARYKLYGCPACGTVYKHPLWGSVSVHIPRSINPELDRICVKCGFQAKLDGWSALGTVERFTPEEQTRRSAFWLPDTEPPTDTRKALQKVKEFLLGRPPPVDPSEQYPLIKIAGKVELK